MLALQQLALALRQWRLHGQGHGLRKGLELSRCGRRDNVPWDARHSAVDVVGRGHL